MNGIKRQFEYEKQETSEKYLFSLFAVFLETNFGIPSLIKFASHLNARKFYALGTQNSWILSSPFPLPAVALNL